MSYRDGLLVQTIAYILLWLYDDYVGLVISAVMAAILLALVCFAAIAELIEKSKVPASYYKWMLLSIIPPVVVSLFFTLITGGQFSWINQFGLCVPYL